MSSQPDRDRALASVLLVSYRQELFVRDAVRSAFAQTYSPLEIVISDDCSPDRTFEIIEEEAQTYKGPHRIVLNRNEPNLGVAGNYNRAFELANGMYCIVQDGDDISRPDRVETFVRAFREPTPVDMVCCDVVMIDENGARLPDRTAAPVWPLELAEAVVWGSVSALGCACGYAREIWAKYGPLDREVLQEDAVLSFRALLGSGIRVLEERLVNYRIHTGNLFAGRPATESRERRRHWARSWRAVSADMLRAWSQSAHQEPRLERRLRRHLLQRELDAVCYDRAPPYALLAAARALVGGLTVRKTAGLLRRHAVRLG